MEVIIEGKVKTVYQGDDAEQVIIEYHDKVTAGNGEKEDYPLGKGSLCCSISSLLFERLAKVSAVIVPPDLLFVRQPSNREHHYHNLLLSSF